MEATKTVGELSPGDRFRLPSGRSVYTLVRKRQVGPICKLVLSYKHDPRDLDTQSIDYDCGTDHTVFPVEE